MIGKWRVLAIRSAGSVCGAAERYCSSDNKELQWQTEQAAEAYAAHMNETNVSPHLSYRAELIEGT